MKLNLLLLKLTIKKKIQILLWESIKDIHLWILLTFNYNYINKRISKELKSVILLGDFNVNLLSYNEHNQF